MTRLNLHIYPSPITHESRMLKETASLKESGLFDELHLVGVRSGNLPEVEILDDTRKIVRLGSNKAKVGFANRILGFLGWMLQIYSKYKGTQVTVVSCHCLAVLPLGIIFKIFLRSRIVYEAHELETERNGWSQSRRIISKILEYFCIKFVDHTVVVGPSIEHWYRNEYRIQNVSTVRNIPTKVWNGGKTDLLRKKFNIPDGAIIFLYQGIFNRGRGIEVLLKVFSDIPHHHVVFLGFGPLKAELVSWSLKYPNIHVHDALPPDQIGPYTASADVGLAIFENTSLSYYFSCPNKLFEYILGGIPVIASDFPDMAAIIDKYNCGWKCQVNAEHLRILIASITDTIIAEKASNFSRAAHQLSWTNEAKRLKTAYSAFLQPD